MFSLQWRLNSLTLRRGQGNCSPFSGQRCRLNRSRCPGKCRSRQPRRVREPVRGYRRGVSSVTATQDDSFVRTIARTAAHEREEYAQGTPRPLGSYGVLLSVYLSMTGGLTLLVRRRRHRGATVVPERVALPDLALVAIATHRLSRLITKDSVTAVVRAPFTQFKEAAGEGEVNEDVGGAGLRHAVGELLTCPFCIAQWIATGFAFALVLAPRATRAAAATLTAVTASDWLQFAHSALQKTEE